MKSERHHHIPPSDISHLTPTVAVLQLAVFYGNLGISLNHLFL